MAYESQKIDVKTEDDLMNALRRIASGKSTSGTLTENQAYTNFNDGVGALVTMIENAANPNDLVNTEILANNLTSIVSPGNVEGITKLAQVNQDLGNTTQDYINYKGVIDEGYYLLNEWVMPEMVQGLGDIDVLSQPADMPTFPQAIDTGEQSEEVASDLYTIDNIKSALDKINNFESSLYTDPMKRDKEVKFIGNYPLKSEAGEIIGKDIDIINRITGDGGLKDKLLTALAAFEGDNLITNNEIYYIITGDEVGLETARTENIELSKNNLISYRRSSNSIRSYQKQILNAIAIGKINKKDNVLEALGVNALYNATEIDDIDRNHPMYAGMDDEDIKATMFSQYEGMSIAQIMAHWEEELIKYEFMSKKESRRFKLWANQDFEFPLLIDDIAAEKMRRVRERHLPK